MFEELRKKYEAEKEKNKELEKTISTLESDNAKLHSENSKLQTKKDSAQEKATAFSLEKRGLNRRVKRLQTSVKAKNEGKIFKKTQDLIIRKRLEGKLSVPVLNCFLKNRKGSRQWSNIHYQTALDMTETSKKCYNKFRQKLNIPLPSISSIQQRFSFVSVQTGYLQLMLRYLSHQTKKPTWKPNDGVCVISFDEMGLSPFAQFDDKTEACLGGKMIEF